MPIFLEQIVSTTPQGGTGPLVFDADYHLIPDETVRNGCPLLNRTRLVTVQKGVRARIRWQLRLPNGVPVNLLGFICPDLDTSVSDCSTSSSASSVSDSSLSESISVSVSECVSSGRLKVRFASCDRTGPIYEVCATTPDPANGIIEFQIPQEVADEAGIYVIDIAVLDSSCNVLYTETGLISVEPGLWGNINTSAMGPPTINQIRTHLRDLPGENELLMESEFSDTEIIQAVIWPVMCWNEAPPDIGRYNCRNFPFIYNWRQAIVSELLRAAAHNYMRNNLTMNVAGVSGNMKDKFKDYLVLAETYREEYRRFVVEKKVELNARMGVGSFGSTYGYW
jgi:hypothetical protein